MLIIPTGLRHEIRRELIRLKPRFSLLSFISLITLLGSVCAILGISLRFLLEEQIHPTLYLVIVIALLYTTHYCRAYYREKRKKSSADSSLRVIHEIAHSLRELILKTSLFDSATSIRKCYLQAVKTECHEIARHLHNVLRSFGYNVGHVCIKTYNSEIKGDELSVLARSYGGKKDWDEGEPEEDNPFFKLLLENHFSDRLYKCPVLKKIKQNKDTGEPKIKYLGIGDLSRVQFPESVHQLLMEYEQKTGNKIKETSAKEILQSIQKRSRYEARHEGYQSLLGILISNGNPSVEGRPCEGFIGIDSGSSCAWDFINENHLNVIAAVADLLYEPITTYNRIHKDLLIGGETKLDERNEC